MTAASPARGSRRPVQGALLTAVRFYQRAISPTRPPRCRFVPSCSAYALEAIEVHGAARGGWLALRRLLKCAPWHPGGVDLVPPLSSGRRAGTPTVAHTYNSAAPISAPSAVSPDGASAIGPSHPAGLRPGPAAGDLR